MQFGGASGPVNGPDGISWNGWPGTNINGYGGDLRHSSSTDARCFWWVCFWGPTRPAEVGRISWLYSAASADGLVFNPLLAQVFFVGDGRGTGYGQQTFYVPTGASRLFFGFADGVPEFGSPSGPVNPGAYGDNLGSLNVNYNLNARPSCITRNLPPSS